MNRKDEHIKYALTYESTCNSFDDMELIQCSIPEYNLDEIDMSVNFAENTFEYPFFINAMTGGSKKGKEINRKLAKVAKECNILFVTGSYSAALKNTDDDSSEVVRKENEGLLLGTNIGADKDYTAGKKAIEDLTPLFLQIHVNLMQELIMPEGSRNFNEWKKNISGFVKNIKIPLILKEVGFGMSADTIKKGIIASGGVRNPLDIIKALVLGARAVGLSGTMLRLAENNSTEEIIEIVNSWKEECRMIMCALNAKNVKELQKVKYVLYGKTREFCLK